MILLTFVVVIALAAVVAQAAFVPGTGGYITTEKKDNLKLWYWLFEAQEVNPTDDDTPFVLWLTGGPGCSGSLAALSENGPYKVNEDLSLRKNPWSWNMKANMLYVDQPYGVGYSVDPPADYVTNTKQAMADVLILLDEFFVQNPQYAKQPFFITGESFGGHYVPELARQILLADSDLTDRLQAIEIGNGMINPLLQFPKYPAYASMYDMVSSSVIAEADQMVDQCVQLIENGPVSEAYDTCLPIIEYILEHTDVDGHQANPYNRLLPCLDGGLCYNMTLETDWLNLPAVQKALNVDGNVDWATCNYAVNADFTDWTVSYANGAEAMLAAGKRVLIMAGKLDYICNYLGSQATALALNWSGKSSFNKAPMKDWYIGNTLAGSVQTYENLHLIFVNKAGHLVPMDQPESAYVLFENYINNAAFNTTS